MNTPAILKDTPKGELVRLKDTPTAPVWVRGDYDREAKAYSLHAWDDTNRVVLRKGATKVFVGFTF